jgi:4-amino-4-deoxy-L-arabinose transferase-like glycosyltransferase
MTACDRGGAGWRRPAAVLSLFLLALGLLVAGRLHLPFLEPEESLYAVVARDTLADGEFVVPVLRGEPYLDKPPLLYWLTMGSYRAFGVHVWSARLVPALVAWLTVLLVFAWGRACGGWAVGFASAAVLALTGDFCYRGPMVTPNGLLGLLTTAGLACGHIALRGGRLRTGWWVASAVATGLAVLTKGPVGVVLVAAPLLVFPWVSRGFARPGLRAWLLFLIGVVVVAGPWFVAVSARQPGFVEYFFWKHNVRRFTDPFDHAKPWHFYLPQMLLGGLPWTILPLAAGWQAGVNRRGPNWLSPDGAFALTAAACGLVFFSLAGSKRSVYLVPLWPVVAFGVGTILAPVLTGSTERRLNLSSRGWLRIGGTVAGVLLTGLLAWLPAYHRQFGLADAASGIAARDPGVPVYCYPHPWNSLDFTHDGGALPAFRPDELPLLVARLRSSGRALVVVKTGASREDLLRALPGDVKVVDERPSGMVSLLAVRRPEPKGCPVPP